MLAIQPIPPPDDDADIRLDVRLGNGPMRVYVLREGEFHVGAAAGCDLRLAGSQYPPVVCQFSRDGGGLRVRKLSPIIPVTVNDQPLNGSTPSVVNDGDIVRAGPAELHVQIAREPIRRPRLVAIPDDEPAAGDPWDELSTARRELEEQRRELDEDRAIWYRRRMEMEAEMRGPPDADELRRRESAVTARERELQHEFDRRFAALEAEVARRRAELELELESRRQKADGEFHDRMRILEEEIAQRRLQLETELRDCEPRLQELRAAQARWEEREAALTALREELARDRDAIDDERRWQFTRLRELDSALLERHTELTRRENQLKIDLENLTNERDRLKEDLLRFERRQAELESRFAAVDGRTAEVNERHDLLDRTSREWEETLRLAEADQKHQREESERLERLKADLEQRESALANRLADCESLTTALALDRAALARQQETLHADLLMAATERRTAEALRRELAEALQQAEQTRKELGQVRQDNLEEVRIASERSALLAAQSEELRAAEERIQERERELDARSADFAEQVALLKSRLTQTVELQERLEADRASVKAREALLSESDSARLEFQEQLRRRAEELAARSREVDDLRIKLAEEHAVLSRLREGLELERSQALSRLEAERNELADRVRDLESRASAQLEREEALERQVERLKEAGESVAADRKALIEARAAYEAEQSRFLDIHQAELARSDETRARVSAHFSELQALAPELERTVQQSLDRLASAREVLRGNLTDLHDYARQTREELESERSRLRIESDELRRREHELESARSEHRLGVAGFRQQLLDWQSKIAELRMQFDAAQNRLERRGEDVNDAAREIADLREDLERQTREAAAERRKAHEKRQEMERHLSDMREWYRRKLRELAAGRKVDEADMPEWSAAPADAPPAAADETDADPGDRQLGELLVARGLVDDNTLAALADEARRQNKSLRQTLLASGALTLYQLALIEAGTLDGLMLGRLRVVDRIRVTSREAAYRVFDPSRPGGPTRGIYVLRHLSESEMQDAVRPDEFRQRFGTMASASHPNLANTLELMEIQGRPAALQEWVAGLSSADWPPAAAAPGVWLRLMTEAARGIQHAHRSGFVHGRLVPDSFLITPDGTLKIIGFGEPHWLNGGPSGAEPPASVDLRALGRIAFVWSQLGSRRRGVRSKPFPAELTAVIRRLEIGSEPAMGDVVSIDRPFADAGELIRELARLSELHPCPADTWERLIRYAAEHSPDTQRPLRAAG